MNPNDHPSALLKGRPLVLFDLDDTLLRGDIDHLWCKYLVHSDIYDKKVLCRDMHLQKAYKAGVIDGQDFCQFYAGLLKGFAYSECLLLRELFIAQIVKPKIPLSSFQLVRQHLKSGALLLMTSASNHFIAQPVADYLGISHLIATQLELNSKQVFTGCVRGLANIQEAKLENLKNWLMAHDIDSLAAIEQIFSSAYFYSDSINDLPLLSAVGHPVATNPDINLARIAADRQWETCWLWNGTTNV